MTILLSIGNELRTSCNNKNTLTSISSFRFKTKHAIDKSKPTISDAYDVADLQNELGYLYLITENADILLCFKSIIESGLSIDYDYQMDKDSVLLLGLLQIVIEYQSSKNENVQIVSTLGMKAISSKRSTQSSLLANMYNIDSDNQSSESSRIQIRT